MSAGTKEIRIQIKWLKLLNVIILQWFFVRLTLCRENVIISTHVRRSYKWYALQGFICPLTGWISDFIYVSKEKYFLSVTKKKESYQ